MRRPHLTARNGGDLKALARFVREKVKVDDSVTPDGQAQLRRGAEFLERLVEWHEMKAAQRKNDQA